MKKTLCQTLALLSLPLAITSCNNPAYESNVRAEATPTPIPYSFDKLGNIGELKGNGIQIVVKDLDGDGDLDIIGFDRWGRIRAYENKISQKHNLPTTTTVENYQ